VWAAWRYGGEDPWRLFNMLDSGYRPLRDPERPAFRPARPSRVRAFMYACGRVALKIEGKVEQDPLKMVQAAKQRRGGKRRR
jgi:hypothetical protein